MNHEYGGYFELELRNGTEYHQDAIALNTGRNCLEYILRTKKYTTIYIPYYTCDAILEPIKKTNTKFIYYYIDNSFKPIIDMMKFDSVLLYTNYFGICECQIQELTNVYKNIIIDNSQSFYSKPIEGTSTFYSCRKFFGVPDGAYLYCDNILDESFEYDVSENRFNHLIKRIEYNAEEGYQYFKKNEASFSNQPIKFMSKLTNALLKNVDYNFVKTRRIENYNYLYKELKSINELNIDLKSMNCPMVYPLVIKNQYLRNILIKKKIYIPTFWNSVMDLVDKKSYEYYLAKYLLPLPIDQRYNKSEMDLILSTIKCELNA